VVSMDDDAIRELVTRLARPHPSGGEVIERAGILAAGADSAVVMAWIADHDGVPEAAAAAPGSSGLHGARLGGRGAQSATPVPLRFVLPAGALA
jgi:hypothetical protein